MSQSICAASTTSMVLLFEGTRRPSLQLSANSCRMYKYFTQKGYEMYRLQVKLHFDAAHYLKGYKGKCSRMHGHRWGVEVCVEGRQLNDINMIVDFKTIKGIMTELIEDLDHYVLNEVLHEDNPTAEYLAKWFHDWMEIKLGGFGLPDNGVRLARVTIWESPDCCVKYSLGMRATGVE